MYKRDDEWCEIDEKIERNGKRERGNEKLNRGEERREEKERNIGNTKIIKTKSFFFVVRSFVHIIQFQNQKVGKRCRASSIGLL